MAPLDQDSKEVQEIDKALAQWRQGDLALDVNYFLHLADTSRPLTTESDEAGGDGLMQIMSEVAGLVVISQTCDIVRSCAWRPFVEVAPLVTVEPQHLKSIQRGYRPQYAFIPTVADKDLVADLDRVMTVEKSVVASWTGTAGWESEDDMRRLSEALARKRSRPAFPDDFVGVAGKFQKRLKKKHDKNSAEGEALRALREIRVRAAPSWDAPKVEVFFWFIELESHPQSAKIVWPEHLERWLDLLTTDERFVSFEGAVVTLESMTAQDYVESDRLDLDHLSSRQSH